jgi:hypothetical protein
MNKAAIDTILALCMEAAPSLPVTKRILVYTALADMCADAQRAAEFRRIVGDLEAAEARHQHLALTWGQSGANGGR